MTEENPDNKDSSEIQAFQAPPTTEKERKDTVVISELKQRATHFQGPLPPPEILIAYERLVPGCAKEIIGAFTKQANHRMDLERTVIKGDSNRAYLGIGCAFVISLVVIWLSYVLIARGFGTTGALLATFDLAALAGVFVYGTNSRRKERDEKRTMLKQVGN